LNAVSSLHIGSTKIGDFHQERNDQQHFPRIPVFRTLPLQSLVMRKSNQEITDQRTLHEILSENVICRLAFADPDGPYLLPFNFGYRDGTIYIHSAPDGRKIELLRNDNRVCFEVEDAVQVIPHERACGWATRYRSVVGYGTVEILTTGEGKREGLQAIMSQHGAPEMDGFEPGNVDRMVVLKLTITSMTGKRSGNWE